MADDFLEKTLDALDRLDVDGDTPHEVVAAALEDFGVTAMVMLRLASLPGDGHSVMFSNMPTEWTLRYREAGYAKVDPVTPTALTAARPFRWDELPAGAFKGEASTLFDEAAEFRLKDGFCVPVRGVGGSGAVSMAGESLFLPRAARRMVEMLVTQTFNRTICDDLSTFNATLSSRERDVLSWVAAGKTAQEAGDILGISGLTVTEHLKRVRQRMGTSNTAHTVATAIRMGLVTL